MSSGSSSESMLRAQLRRLTPARAAAALGVLAAAVFIAYQSYRALVPQLEVSLRADYEPWSAWQLHAQGSAYSKGRPLAQGTAVVTIETSSPSLEYSLHVGVRDGRFDLVLPREQMPMAVALTQDGKPLPLHRVSVRVTGLHGERGYARVLGPNLVESSKVLWACGFFSALVLLFSFLFTGDYSPAKQRGAIAYAYIVAAIYFILPLAVPVAVAVVPGVGYQLAQTPVGFLRVANAYMHGGDADQPDKPLRVDQWSVNVGGTPVQQAANDVQTQFIERKDDLSASYDVRGGLVVPLFVVVLATLGGAFRMTRAVPEIERTIRAVEHHGTASISQTVTDLTVSGSSQTLTQRAESIETSIALEPRAPEASALLRDALADARKDLTHQVLYLFTSPFMGILAYYSLVLVHQEFGAKTPIVAVIAFVSGMKSEDVLQQIVGLAKFPQRSEPSRAAPVPAKVIRPADA